MEHKRRLMQQLLVGLGATVLLVSSPFANELPAVEDHSIQAGTNDLPSGNAYPTVALMKQLEAMRNEIQELRGLVELQTHKSKQLTNQQRDLYLDLDKRLREKQDSTVVSQSKSSFSLSDVKSGESSIQIELDDEVPEVQVPQTSVKESTLYQEAYNAIQVRNFDLAKTHLLDYLKTFPNGSYQPNAHYWLGEVHLLQGQFLKASDEFHVVLNHFPEHQKAPDALLKIGYIEYQKGKWQKASSILGSVADQYPESASARLAQNRLKRMQKEGVI